ncbi:MAG: MBL fold metallo-hydrolase [Chloroflexota bacterium]
MRLTVLGAGPAYTDRVGATGAAYLLSSADDHLLLDLGQGSLPRLFAAIEPSALSAVVVSHLHPDHFIDLVALRHYLRYQLDPPRRLRVVGPRGLDARLDALHADPRFSAEAFDVEGLSVGARNIGVFGIESARVTHTEDSYAFRVTADGASLVYSGDCGRAEDLDALLRPGDALLVEVSFGPGPVPAGALHLDGPAIGELAARARPGRVLLTHLQMGFDPDETIESVARQYDGAVEFVWPGSVIDLG